MNSAGAVAGDSDDGFALHAWVDESMHVDAGLYLLAAVVADPSTCDPHRDQLRSLLVRSQPTLHWHREGPQRRAAIIQTVATIDMTAVVIVGTPMNPRRQERARAVCMESLAVHLAQIGVTQVTLEAREAGLNARDRRLVESIRGKKLIPSTLRFETELPSAEPMLWLPDIVAGAVGQERVRANPAFLSPIRNLVTELQVPLR